MTDIRADLRATNQQLLASVTPSGSSPVSLPLPAALPDLIVALPDLLQHRGRLIDSLLQGMVKAIIGHEGRQAASFFISRGEQLGQALDSGGSDHIAGQRDVGVAYAWRILSAPIPVTTANGVIYATWECTVPTILGPMRCYYLENGGPPQSLLSVDKLCREGEYTYVHSKWGARIVDPNGNIENLIADGGLHYLPAATNDSHLSMRLCDESLAEPAINSYSSTFHSQEKIQKSTNNTESSLLTSSKSRLGTCDNDGPTEVLRGPKPQTRVAPRAYAQQSRYTPLWNNPIVPEAEDHPVDVDDTLMPASYVVQTRSRVQATNNDSRATQDRRRAAHTRGRPPGASSPEPRQKSSRLP